MKNDLELHQFYVQFFFSCIFVGFCIFKLSVLPEKGRVNESLYWGGLLSVISWWLPSPASRLKQTNNTVAVDSEETYIDAGSLDEK